MRFAQTGIIGKTGPWQMASAIRKSHDVRLCRAGDTIWTSEWGSPPIYWSLPGGATVDFSLDE
jgi:hypothetical protein